MLLTLLQSQFTAWFAMKRVIRGDDELGDDDYYVGHA